MSKIRIPSFTEDEIDFGIHFIHKESRTRKARQVDEHMSSRITQDPFEWLKDPNRYDWGGIDTIETATPSGYTKQKGRKAAEKIKRVHYGF